MWDLKKVRARITSLNYWKPGRTQKRGMYHSLVGFGTNKCLYKGDKYYYSEVNSDTVVISKDRPSNMVKVVDIKDITII